MHNTEQNNLASTLANELLKEKRTDRRWRNIRFIAWFLLFAYATISIIGLMNGGSSKVNGASGKYASLVRLDGMIAPGRDFSAESIVPVLRQAFSDKKAVGVVIDINSPGGTPVQASIIHDAIIAFKKRYHKKVIIVGEDMLTSGAYYVAVAGDNIYVNPNTLTGSIGVIMKGFGFVDLMKKMGVERRVYVAGDNKDRLDPFLPQNPEDLKKIQQVIGEVHNNFAEIVLAGRKGRLHADPKQLFTGDFWSGQTALKLGLVDGLGNLMEVMEKEFGTTKFQEYSSGYGFMHLLGDSLSSALDNVSYYLYA